MQSTCDTSVDLYTFGLLNAQCHRKIGLQGNHSVREQNRLLNAEYSNSNCTSENCFIPYNKTLNQ